jgi:hypothetical protein
MADYLPKGDEDFAVWLNNFQDKFGGYATSFGFVAADATAVTADYTMFRYLQDTLSGLRPAAQALTAYRDAVRAGPAGAVVGDPPIPGPFVPPPTDVTAGIEARVRQIVQRIKSHPGYTTAIGEDLGIIAPAPSTGAIPPKPQGTATAQPDSEVRISFVKRTFTGVQVESQRAAETAWTVLGVDLQSPYLDARPPLAAGQPEVRKYRLRYLQNDAVVGDYSDVMTVTTQP